MLIYSALGATRNYPDKGMMERTLSAFINSLARQTDRRLRLFLVGHDKPKLGEHDFLHWHSLSCDSEHKATLVPKALPKTVYDILEYEAAPFEGKSEDMSRKVRHGIIQAALWAHKGGLKEFWMMRMDSDDLLAKDTVEKIHDLDRKGIGAVFNRTCHMFDPKRKEIAIHRYPYSTTPSALKFKINPDGTLTPNWFYMCIDHTLFYRRVKRDGIPFKELDFTYCIVTNTGNNISGRSEIGRERHARRIPLTNDLIDRYGLDQHLQASAGRDH